MQILALHSPGRGSPRRTYRRPIHGQGERTATIEAVRGVHNPSKNLHTPCDIVKTINHWQTTKGNAARDFDVGWGPQPGIPTWKWSRMIRRRQRACNQQPTSWNGTDPRKVQECLPGHGSWRVVCPREDGLRVDKLADLVELVPEISAISVQSGSTGVSSWLII